MTGPDRALAVKEARLYRLLREMGGVLVAFSGGVDSTLLACAAERTLGGRAMAVTASSPTYPRQELAEARKLARLIGIRHLVIETAEWDNETFRANPPDRCYHCKSELFRALAAVAGREQLPFVADASTISDDADYRPGARAALEAGVRRPLREAGLNKDEVRRLSRKLALPTADKPAAACLASRIPCGVPLTRETLKQVEAAENYLRRLMPVGNLRVRAHGDTARIEVDTKRLAEALAARQRIIRRLGALGFRFVTLDLAGYRTGSLNPPAAGK